MRAWIENQYGEITCELQVNGEDEFVIPEGTDPWPCFFCEGDTYTVKVERNE